MDAAMTTLSGFVVTVCIGSSTERSTLWPIRPPTPAMAGATSISSPPLAVVMVASGSEAGRPAVVLPVWQIGTMNGSFASTT